MAMHLLQPDCTQLHRKGKAHASSHRRMARAKKSLTMDVLYVPVYMQVHTETTLFFLRGVSDLKDFDMYFHKIFQPTFSHSQAVILITSLEYHHVAD